MLQKKGYRFNLFYLLKTGFGTAVAILIAESLGLAFSPSAGIITLLTIQNTKKETIVIALKRVVAFFVAVTIAFLVFSFFGYTPIAFGIFALIFVALCIFLELKDGISMNAVLATHFLVEQRFDPAMIFNEIAILFIGMGIGILLNLIMPKYKERIRREQLELEDKIKKVLRGLSKLLKDKDACLVQVPAKTTMEKQEGETPTAEDEGRRQGKPLDFTALDEFLESLLEKAYEDAGNTLLSNTKYLVSYLEMRKLQLEVLKEIKNKIQLIPVILRQSLPIAEYMEHIADSFHELNNAEELILRLDELYEYFRKEALPQTREEFEYRSMLFQILMDIEYFLILKRNFMKELDNKNMKSYWVK